MDEIWLDLKQGAELENVTERAIRKRIQSKLYKDTRIVPSRNGGGQSGQKLEIALSCLSTEARAKFFRQVRELGGPSTELRTGALDSFDREPEYKKREALRWLGIIEAFEAFDKAQASGRGRCRAARDFCKLYAIEHPEERPFSDKTLFRKIKEFRASGIEGLLNGFGNSHIYKEWPEEAKAFLFQKYCNPNQPTASWCIDQLAHHAKQHGWRLPSGATMRRYLISIPPETRDYYRRGRKFWQEHYVPSVLRDYESLVPGEIYVSDHQQINVAVRHPSGKILFPWFTGWKDMRSRKILGWILADVPSSNTINLSLKHTIERYGAPEHIVIDNGRDFSAKHFTGGQTKRFRFKVKEDELAGIYKLLHIEPHFAIPANAKAKNIERWFWTQEQDFQKAFPAYRGNNIMHRPEGADQRITTQAGRYVLEWEEFKDYLGNYVETYNQDHAHHGHAMNGATPNSVWTAYFKDHAQRRVSPSALRLLMMVSRKVKVGRFGITAFGGTYRSSELMEYQGSEVIYRYDPEDLAILYIYKLENSFLCTAERTDRTAWNDEEAYVEIRRLEKRKKQAIKAQMAAAENLVQVEFGYTKREPSGEHPDRPAKVVRVLRTDLDHVQEEVDAHEEHRAERISFDELREKFNESTRRRLEERNARKQSYIRPFKLSMPD